MCGLCNGNQDEVRSARNEALAFANKLEQLAGAYHDMGRGLLRPHTEEFTKRTGMVKSILREIVNDLI